MLSRYSLNITRAFSKHFLNTQWKRSDPNRYWRVQHNLPKDDEEHGPLADLPDYSYLNGEPSHLSPVQRKKYDFNASVVRRIHELDAELAEAKRLYADKIASAMTDYNKTAQMANRIKTPNSSTKVTARATKEQHQAISSISSPNEYSFQPNLLNALREKATYNEAFEEVVDPVGAIVPNKLMSIERPPYKRTGERRRFHKVFKIRTPRLRMFPR
ncbi:unnamed protein product [Adineta ricciae]|uniref:Large ribosomal subunit protein mL52 n=1 Tax=Adineta ricciae TaxID=249248 RepID=A0A814N6W4_ADIRI|nr:unnamed protein product [Adineta ricciae]